MGAINFSMSGPLVQFLQEKLPLDTFIETGTFKGDTLRSVAGMFKECFSVELSSLHHQAAEQVLKELVNVQVSCGPSPEFLAQHQKEWSAKPVLFWLDAHWCSADQTAGFESQSPLIDELKAIGRLHYQSVLLIDDARLYLCPPPLPHRYRDWPDFDEIITALRDLSAEHRVMIWNDVIVFYPKAIRSAIDRFASENGVDWLSIVQSHEKRLSAKRKLRTLWGLLSE